MSKKLILLMLALPLILMLSLFTATSTVSLAVSVPVSKIEISSENVVYLDLDRAETYELEYTVYPTNAANKKVTFSTQAVEGAPHAELEYNEETSVITPKTCGKARVTLTTVDGGFKDSFIVQVDSKSLEAIDATISDTIIDIGETATISTTFNPKNAPNKQLKYEVIEGADFVSVDSQGVVTGKGVGTATIRVLSRMNEAIFDEVEIAVSNSAAMQFIEKDITNTVQEAGGSIPLFMDDAVDFTYNIEVVDENGVASEAITYTVNEATKTLDYTYVDAGFEGTVSLNLTVTVEGVEPYSDSCTLTRIREIEAAWVGDASIVLTIGDEQYIYFTVTPPGAKIEYEILYENDLGYISVEENIEGKELIVKAESAGATLKESYTRIILRVWATNNPTHMIELRMTVSVRPSKAS